MKAIPVENIYFLLCYAWDRLEEGEIVDVDPQGITQLVDLFGRVLANGVSQLLKRGLDREYRVRDESIAGVRGKLAVSTTIKRNLLSRAHTHCEFDELTYDVIHNQILRKTLLNLTRISDMDAGLRSTLHGLYRRLDGISELL